jgi:lysophospholipase L1-like esterase
MLYQSGSVRRSPRLAVAVCLAAAVTWALNDNTLQLRAKIANTDQDYIAVIGDSITAFAPVQQLNGKTVLHIAYGGAQVVDAVQVLLPLLTGKPPAVLIIAIGVNDAKRRIKKSRTHLLADVATDYRALLLKAKTLTPKIAVVLSPPVARGRHAGDAMFDPSLIVAINEIIRAAAVEADIPVFALSDLADADGAARVGTTVDGVHLSAAGYEIWGDVIARAWQAIRPVPRDKAALPSLAGRH